MTSPSRPNLLISYRDEGLCNRIKCLVSAIKTCEEEGAQLILCWPKTKYCGCSFSELFENDIVQKSEAECFRLIYSDHELIYSGHKSTISVINTWRLQPIPNEVPERFARVYPDPHSSGRSIDFEFDRIPESVRTDFLVHISKLVPNRPILDTVNEFKQDYRLEELVGVHIRRGDSMYHPDNRASVSHPDSFAHRIEKLIELNPNVRFFLSTDCVDTERRFLARFPGRFATFKKDSRDRHKREAIKEALIDLLLLSTTKHILGSYKSTFTEMAWWFGGCEAKVEIIGL